MGQLLMAASSYSENGGDGVWLNLNFWSSSCVAPCEIPARDDNSTSDRRPEERR